MVMRPTSRILFVRVGRHASYAGPQNDDDWPKGAGRSAVNHHHEAFNFFRDFGGTLYGAFGISKRHLNLRRIDPALANDPHSADGVLVVFVARYDGQRIVGWYRRATVYNNKQRVEYPRDARDRIQEHFRRNHITRYTTEFNHYLLDAERCDAVLRPEDERKDGPLIPRGRGGMGESNVCYAYDENHELKLSSPWIQEAVDFIGDYHGPNLLSP